MTENEDNAEIDSEASSNLGIIKKNLRKIGLVIILVFLACSAFFAFMLFEKQGETLECTVDGKIDGEFYQSLISNPRKLADISEIADLLAEVYYLTHGEDLSQFGFTLFEPEDRPMMFYIVEIIFRAFALLGEKYTFYGAGAMNLGNGDIFIKNREDFPYLLRLAFHEFGHGISRSYPEQVKNILAFVKVKVTARLDEIECSAESNVIDSIIALMYLDPDLGFAIFRSSSYGGTRRDRFFEDFFGEYAIARNYAKYRCIKRGHIEDYSKVETLKEDVEELVSRKTADELVIEMRQGILDMFAEKFGDRRDFPEKYSLLQKYMESDLPNAFK
jgi:hypothetical protein